MRCNSDGHVPLEEQQKLLRRRSSSRRWYKKVSPTSATVIPLSTAAAAWRTLPFRRIRSLHTFVSIIILEIYSASC